MVFTVRSVEIRIGEGQASKVFVTREGKSIQVNYLEKGERAEVEKIAGGIHLKEKFEQLGLKEGAEITLLRKETPAPTPQKSM